MRTLPCSRYIEQQIFVKFTDVNIKLEICFGKQLRGLYGLKHAAAALTGQSHRVALSIVTRI